MGCPGFLVAPFLTHFGGKRSVEAAHGCQRLALGFPLAPHLRDVVTDFIVACVVAHDQQ
jgi:hypothetical protein